MPFDQLLVEAKLALRRISPNEMPPLAWDALEAGLDGPSIRRLAALVNPSGWETDQVIPAFMKEAGLKNISSQEASVRIARDLAQRILSEGRDPLAYTHYFACLWSDADYALSIQDVGSLDEEKAAAEYIGQSEAEFREYARGVLAALITQTKEAH